jgi:putative ABC transport system permease protein
VLVTIIRRELWANKKSALLSSVSIVACIAYITAVLMISATVQHSFDGFFATSYAHADVIVRSANKVEGEFGRDNRDQISDAYLDRVRHIPGAAEAIGAIEAKALISTLGGVTAQPHEDLAENGGIFVDSVLTPWRLTPGSRAPIGPSEVVIDRHAAAAAGITIGDTVRVTTRIGPNRFTVVGIVTFAGGASAGGSTWALFDQPTAELVVNGGAGLLDEIRVRSDGTVTPGELARRLQQALADRQDLEVLTGAQATSESQGAVGATIRLFSSLALLFAAIAIVGGGFIIAAALATSTARRRTQHGMLRAVGATRRQVGTSTLAEAVVIGLIGALAGFGAGIGLAHVLARLLHGAGLALPTDALVVCPTVLPIDIALALIVTVGAGGRAVFAASRVPPLGMIRNDAGEPALAHRRRLMMIFGAIAVAVAALRWARGSSPSAWMVTGIVSMATAAVWAGAPVVSAVARRASRRRPTPAAVPRWLGAKAIAARPRRFALGANAAMIAVALVVATSTIGTSADASLYDNFAGQISGDVLITSTKPSQQLDGIFPQALAAAIAELPQIARATGVAYQRFTAVGADGRASTQVARAVDPASVAELIDLDFRVGSLRSLTPQGVALSAGKARREGLHLGDHITARLLNGEVHVLTVEGIFGRDDLTNEVVNIHLFDTQVKAVDFGLIVATAQPGVTAADAAAAVRQMLTDFASARVQTRRQFLASQSDRLNQYLHVVDALVALSIFVAIAGVGTMLILSVGERRRELAMLKIGGMTVQQLRRMIAWESLLTCLTGAAEGIVVGLVAGWAIVRALTERGLKHFAVSVTDLVVVCSAAVVIGVVASIWPARRSARLDSLAEISPE